MALPDHQGDGEEQPEFFSSALVRLECLLLPYRERDDERIQILQRYFDEHPPIGMQDTVFDRAARLRATTRLRTPDALHVACAIEAGCDEFWTNDRRLDRLRLPIRVRVFAESQPGTR